MNVRRFFNRVRRDRLAEAIRAAEHRTSGEIRVVVRAGRVADPVAAAEEEFVRLGMTLTRARNAVLILVAPADRAFAVVGDVAIHARCGGEFWQTVVAEMGEYFRNEDPQTALRHAIERIGSVLAAHFPREDADRNELPDGIELRP